MKPLAPLALASLTLVSLLVACGTTPLGDEPTPVSLFPETTETPGPAEESPTTVAQPLVVCSPRAVPYDIGQAPQLPDDLALETICANGTPGVESISRERPTQYVTWSAGTRTLDIRDEMMHFGESDETQFTLAEDGSVVEMHSFGAEGFYASSFGSTWYRLNDHGELDWKYAASMPTRNSEEDEWTVLVKEQAWDGDRLLSRTERDGEDGPILREFVWSYDARNNLVGAQATDVSVPDFERTFSAVYDYDELNRLVSLERFVRGVSVERQTWEWDESGLSVRTFETRGLQRIAEENGGDAWQWSYPGGLDDFEVLPAASSGDPWAQAVGAEREDCTVPAHGLGHGYPEGEPEYDLTWSADQRPSGVGFAYGSDTYGWFYGDQAWFGHFGLGSTWAPMNWDAQEQTVSGRVEYNEAGNMVAESFRFESSLGELSATRSREFAQAGMTSDRATFVVGEVSVERVLRFDRTDTGGLLARELLEGDSVLARQTWQRDDDDNALEFTVEPHEALGTAVLSELGLAASFGNTMAPGAIYSWTYDELGRVATRVSGEAEQAIGYDDEGRITSVEGSFDNDLHPVRRTYNVAGQLAEECSPRGETDWFCYRRIYDEDGRIHGQQSREGDNAEWTLQWSTMYQCRD